jgi:glycine/D-amino acid oxidase-like deaminating enzyme
VVKIGENKEEGRSDSYRGGIPAANEMRYFRFMQLSVWERESFFQHQDIIIIGSGLVGLWSAWELIQQCPKLKITILERSIIPAGASTRNAGFACFGSPSELLHDQRTNGADNMWRIVEMRYKGMQKIATRFKHEDIGLEQCGGYEVYDRTHPLRSELAEGIQWLNKGLEAITGQSRCFEWADEKLNKFGFAGFDSMVENKLEGCLHSGKLVQALIRRLQSLGVQLITSYEVKKWEKMNGRIMINPGEATSITAERLLVCTNAFTPELLPQLKIAPARGQVLLTSPIEGLKWKGAFHFDEGFYYFRNLGKRILLGGARNKAFDDERTTEMVTTDAIQQHLESFLAAHLLPGEPYTIEQRWSGIMGFTENKEPVVENLGHGVTVAISCNGMGLALAPVIAEKVCEMMY